VNHDWNGTEVIERVHGNVSGLRNNHLKRLSNLYRRKVPPATTVTTDLAWAMAEIAREIGRGVVLLIDRRGRVVTVAVGDAIEAPIPQRSGEVGSRLSGLRLIHGHLKLGGLSPNDLTTLFLNRLDAMVAFDIVATASGGVELGQAHFAQIAPPTSSEEDWIVDPPSQLRDLEHGDVLERIQALEEELTRSRGAREVGSSSEERAILVGLESGEGRFEAESRLAELEELTRSAGGEIAGTSLQHRKTINPKTLIGLGKLQELVSLAYHEDADLLVFDRELSPAQAREIEGFTRLKVLDRTQVILDIFAQNARGREAQVQVELSQLNYQLPRLAGRGNQMSRLGGGIGTRGPGETKLEVDRRRIRTRISSLETEVDSISRQRSETRKNRRRGHTPIIALVGYTNAGKSTLFNIATKSNALTRNKLFSTLRPTTKEGWLPDLGEWGARVLYTDTVGFIRDLPDELRDAFRATLAELHEADLLLHVVDAAMPGAPDRVEAVNRILDDLELDPPRHIVLNKADAADPTVVLQLKQRYGASVVSASTKSGLDSLKSQLAAELNHTGVHSTGYSSQKKQYATFLTSID
jgi:GTP-binding protein HflX